MKEHNVLVTINADGVVTEKPLSTLSQHWNLNEKIVEYARFLRNHSNYFEIFGLQRTIVNSNSYHFEEKLQKEYKKLVSKYGNLDHPTNSLTGNERITKYINSAYNVLSNKYKRNKHINDIDDKTWMQPHRKIGMIYWPEPTSVDEENNRVWNLGKRLSMTFGSIVMISTSSAYGLNIFLESALGGAGVASLLESLKKECNFSNYTFAVLKGAVIGVIVKGVEVKITSLFKEGAALTVEGGAAMTVEGGAAMAVKGGASMTVEGGAAMAVERSAPMAIEEGAAMAVEGDAAICVKAIPLTGKQHAMIRAAKGFTNGTLSSGIEDLKDGRVPIGRIVANGAVGAIAGAIAGAVGDAELPKVDHELLEKGARKVAEKGAGFCVKKIGKAPVNFIEERIDEEKENKSLFKHLKCA